MKLYFSICFQFLFSIIVTAQDATIIKGIVIDKKTLEAVPFVNIYVNNTTIGTQTNENGAFFINASTLQNK